MTSQNIEVPISRMRYDIMLPLLEGRVKVPGVTFLPERGPGAMVFADNPQLRKGDFGLADLNLGYLPQVIENGWEVAALPVISKRKGVLQFIWARTDRGIDSPKDLEGKLIGTSSFTTAITVFVRGLLQHRYDVDISKLRWKANGRDFFPNYGDVQPEYFEDRTNPVDRLFNGEVDAIVADVSDGEAWRRLAASDEVRLLFPDYPEEDFAIYKEMAIFPPMHLMVMSRKLDRDHPGLARELNNAFETSKAMAYEEALNDRAGFSVLYQREIMFDQEAKWGDPFAHGYAANQRMFETYFAYNLEQGVIKSLLRKEDVFASGLLDT